MMIGSMMTLPSGATRLSEQNEIAGDVVFSRGVLRKFPIDAQTRPAYVQDLGDERRDFRRSLKHCLHLEAL